MAVALKHLQVEDRLPAAIITLNEPERLNPLSSALVPVPVCVDAIVHLRPRCSAADRTAPPPRARAT